MSENIDAAAVRPAYTRWVTHRGGRLRRWWLHLVLRMTAKRMPVLDADLPALRGQQAGFDARFSRVDPTTRRTAVDCAGVAAEWIAVPETRPERVLLYF